MGKCIFDFRTRMQKLRPSSDNRGLPHHDRFRDLCINGLDAES